MTAQQSLTRAFLGHLAVPLPDGVSPASLGPVLAALLAQAQGAWPDLELADEKLMACLADRVAGSPEPLERLQRLQVADLYLVCACLEGDRRALAIFEERYGPIIDLAMTRLRLSPSQSDEVKQVLRRDLFLGADGRSPLLASYAGTGRLRGWVQITAVRHGLKLIRKEKKSVPLEDHALQSLPSITDDAELQFMKSTYRAAFKQAFREALGSLPPRELNLLRHHFVDGLSTTQIGAIYRVHQTTAARWLVQAQNVLLQKTREELIQRLKIEPADYDTIMKLVRSRLDITLRTFFGERRPG